MGRRRCCFARIARCPTRRVGGDRRGHHPEFLVLADADHGAGRRHGEMDEQRPCRSHLDVRHRDLEHRHARDGRLGIIHVHDCRHVRLPLHGPPDDEGDRDRHRCGYARALDTTAASATDPATHAGTDRPHADADGAADARTDSDHRHVGRADGRADHACTDIRSHCVTDDRRAGSRRGRVTEPGRGRRNTDRDAERPRTHVGPYRRRRARGARARWGSAATRPTELTGR